jgi:hypothetical protein
MNRIAGDLLRIASELMPRIKATFTRDDKIEERVYKPCLPDYSLLLSQRDLRED